MAVGEVLRRLASKVLMAQGPMKQAAADLEPIQCGLGTRGACELIGAATGAIVRELDNRFPNESNWAVLQVDLANAFNCVSRQHMLKAFVKRGDTLDGIVIWIPCPPILRTPPSPEPYRCSARR